jgi:hypothetical protein
MTNKSTVISLHGILTTGRWQKSLGNVLSKHNYISESLDYGYYLPLELIIDSQNQKKIEWFMGEYSRIINSKHQRSSADEEQVYPSIIAHSFGTFIVSYAMLKYEEICFDKVIFCASILPNDFPWETLFARGQVHRVLHEYGANDVWSKICHFVVTRTGTSGSEGFRYPSPQFKERRHEDHRHSDFFSEAHIEAAWIPFLNEKIPKYHIRHGSELINVEEFRKISKQTLAIDEEVYGRFSAYEECRITSAEAERWIDEEPDIYTFLLDRKPNHYVGYIMQCHLPMTLIMQ